MQEKTFFGVSSMFPLQYDRGENKILLHQREEELKKVKKEAEETMVKLGRLVKEAEEKKILNYMEDHPYYRAVLKKELDELELKKEKLEQEVQERMEKEQQFLEWEQAMEEEEKMMMEKMMKKSK